MAVNSGIFSDPNAVIDRAMRAMRRPAAPSRDAVYQTYAADQDVYNRTWKPTPYEPRLAEVVQVAEDLGVDLDTARDLIRESRGIEGGGIDITEHMAPNLQYANFLSLLQNHQQHLAPFVERQVTALTPAPTPRNAPAPVAPQLVAPPREVMRKAAEKERQEETQRSIARRAEEQMAMPAMRAEAARMQGIEESQTALRAAMQELAARTALQQLEMKYEEPQINQIAPRQDLFKLDEELTVPPINQPVTPPPLAPPYNPVVVPHNEIAAQLDRQPTRGVQPPEEQAEREAAALAQAQAEALEAEQAEIAMQADLEGARQQEARAIAAQEIAEAMAQNEMGMAQRGLANYNEAPQTITPPAPTEATRSLQGPPGPTPARSAPAGLGNLNDVMGVREADIPSRVNDVTGVKEADIPSTPVGVEADIPGPISIGQLAEAIAAQASLAMDDTPPSYQNEMETAAEAAQAQAARDIAAAMAQNEMGMAQRGLANYNEAPQTITPPAPVAAVRAYQEPNMPAPVSPEARASALAAAEKAEIDAITAAMTQNEMGMGMRSGPTPGSFRAAQEEDDVTEADIPGPNITAAREAAQVQAARDIAAAMAQNEMGLGVREADIPGPISIGQLAEAIAAQASLAMDDFSPLAINEPLGIPGLNEAAAREAAQAQAARDIAAAMTQNEMGMGMRSGPTPGSFRAAQEEDDVTEFGVPGPDIAAAQRAAAAEAAREEPNMPAPVSPEARANALAAALAAEQEQATAAEAARQNEMESLNEAQQPAEFGVPGPGPGLGSLFNPVAELEQALAEAKANEPYGLGPPSNEMETTDQAFIGRFAVFDEAPTRAERQALAREGKVVVNLDSNAAKDKNGKYITTQLAPMAVIPDNAPPSVRKAAEEYVAEIERLYTEQFGKSRPGVVVTHSQNKRGRTNTVHTEPFNVKEDRAAAFFASPEGQRRHAEILSRTFGKAPEVVFSIPHDPTGREKGKDPGAVGKHGSEVDIARGVLDNLRRETAQFPSTTMTARGRQRNREQPQTEQTQPQRQQRSSLEAIQQLLADLNPFSISPAQADTPRFQPQQPPREEPFRLPPPMLPPQLAPPRPLEMPDEIIRRYQLDRLRRQGQPRNPDDVPLDEDTPLPPSRGRPSPIPSPFPNPFTNPFTAPMPAPEPAPTPPAPQPAPSFTPTPGGSFRSAQDRGIDDKGEPSRSAPTRSVNPTPTPAPAPVPSIAVPSPVPGVAAPDAAPNAPKGAGEPSTTGPGVASPSFGAGIGVGDSKDGKSSSYGASVRASEQMEDDPNIDDNRGWNRNDLDEEDPNADLNQGAFSFQPGPIGPIGAPTTLGDLAAARAAQEASRAGPTPGSFRGAQEVGMQGSFRGAQEVGMQAINEGLATLSYNAPNPTAGYGVQSEDTTEADPDGGMPGGQAPGTSVPGMDPATASGFGNNQSEAQDGPGTNESTTSSNDQGGGGGDGGGGGGDGWGGGGGYDGSGGWGGGYDGGGGFDQGGYDSGDGSDHGGGGYGEGQGPGGPADSGMGGYGGGGYGGASSSPADGESTSGGPMADGGRVKAPAHYKAIIERAMRAARRSRAA